MLVVKQSYKKNRNTKVYSFRRVCFLVDIYFRRATRLKWVWIDSENSSYCHRKKHFRAERRAAAKSGLAKVAVKCSAATFVVNLTIPEQTDSNSKLNWPLFREIDPLNLEVLIPASWPFGNNYYRTSFAHLFWMVYLKALLVLNKWFTGHWNQDNELDKATFYIDGGGI